MRKNEKDEKQLSLFENQDPKPTKKPGIVDLVRDRFERDPNMSQEEYRKWIKFLVHSSFRR